MGAGEPAVPWLQLVTTLLECSETKSLSLSKVCLVVQPRLLHCEFYYEAHSA